MTKGYVLNYQIGCHNARNLQRNDSIKSINYDGPDSRYAFGITYLIEDMSKAFSIKYILSILNCFSRKANNIYNINWTLTKIELNYTDYVLNNDFQKPTNLKRMIKYAELLSAKFAFCRVDFYEVNNIIYLGEITFTPFNSKIKYKKKETEIYLGNLIDISKIKSNHNVKYFTSDKSPYNH